MQIKEISGKITDTDKLPDKEAEVLEAIMNLYNVCQKYDATLFVGAIVGKTKHLTCQYLHRTDPEERTEHAMYILSLINKYVKELTNSQMTVAGAEDEKEI